MQLWVFLVFSVKQVIAPLGRLKMWPGVVVVVVVAVVVVVLLLMPVGGVGLT